ncbi:MAG: sigma-70 family RNA polymerase sigma factor [Bacteroidota bacterium]
MLPSRKNHPQIKKLLEGDEDTIRLLYDTLFPKFSSFVKKNSGTYSDAEETFHNGLYQLIARAKVSGVSISSSFEAYVFTVCKNLWFKELNKRKKEVRNDGVFELKAETEDQISSIINQERWELFEEKIQLLSDNCSQLLKDYFNKVPYSEIVKKFSYATENTAFQRIFKCKKKLTELIKEDLRFKALFGS